MPFQFKPFHWAGQIERRERNLPHWEQEGATYFVTWRLANSVDANTLRAWKQERDMFHEFHPKPWDEGTEKAYQEIFTRRMELWLDDGHGSCVLRETRCREIIAECLHHFEGVRYELACWVIMPNHVHVLFRPLPGWNLDRILHTWKSYTASRINKVLGRQGSLWMDESFDHIVRDKASLERFAKYIRSNPAKACLGISEYSVWDGLDV